MKFIPSPKIASQSLLASPIWNQLEFAFGRIHFGLNMWLRGHAASFFLYPGILVVNAHGFNIIF